MSKKGLAPVITIIIAVLVIGAGIIVYQSYKTRNEIITALSSTTSTTLPTTSITSPTPPNNWVAFRDNKLGVEFKIPSGLSVKTYEPPTHSYSDYYSEIQTLKNLHGTEAENKANYYYDLYKKAGTNLRVFYNDTGGVSDKYNKELLVVFANPSQLSFNDWQNVFEYCDLYNPWINIYQSDACPSLECICNSDTPSSYEIFQQLSIQDNLTIYIGNIDYNFAAFLLYKDKIFIVSKSYRYNVGEPTISINEAKNQFLASDELKILSSLKFTN